ncbi:hypothetical protein HMPREF9701_02136 [Delftia acidovorans CCUG 274B]|nr:hypothetical protein HMPREF9701_02136 [Delftia acidovorans CCUG 274B]
MAAGAASPGEAGPLEGRYRLRRQRGWTSGQPELLMKALWTRCPREAFPVCAPSCRRHGQPRFATRNRQVLTLMFGCSCGNLERRCDGDDLHDLPVSEFCLASIEPSGGARHGKNHQGEGLLQRRSGVSGLGGGREDQGMSRLHGYAGFSAACQRCKSTNVARPMGLPIPSWAMTVVALEKCAQCRQCRIPMWTILGRSWIHWDMTVRYWLAVPWEVA